MAAVRILFSAAGSALITGSLFLLMFQLIALGGNRAGRLESIATIRFGPVELPAEATARSRRKPLQRPALKQPPSPPRLQVPQRPLPQPDLLRPDLPRLQLPLLGGDGSFPGGSMSVDPAFEGDIIPVVRVAPLYPRKAALAGTEGWVRIEFTITESGSVKNPRVVDAQPPRVFNRAALRAILKWKFKPRVVDGVAVERRAAQVIDFTLDQP